MQFTEEVQSARLKKVERTSCLVEEKFRRGIWSIFKEFTFRYWASSKVTGTEQASYLSRLLCEERVVRR